MPGEPKFGPDYSEDVTLDDTTRVRLRLLRPDDKEKLVRGLARLSPQSQYLRFFTTKPKLTDAELKYLTEIDGRNHFAIGAALIDDHGEEGEGVAVGRFVRLPQEPTVAEPAVAVIDDLQGHGLGSILMRRLVEAARERGIERFRSEFLAVNKPIKQLFEELSRSIDPAQWPAVTFVKQGPVIKAEFSLVPVAAPTEEEPASPLETMLEWLELAATRVVELRHRFGMWLGSESIREAWQRFQREHGIGARTVSDTED